MSETRKLSILVRVAKHIITVFATFVAFNVPNGIVLVQSMTIKLRLTERFQLLEANSRNRDLIRFT